MHLRAAITVALTALAVRVAVAQTPACLLAAVNTQPNPADMQAICSGSNATTVTKYICKSCDGDVEAALSEFEGACLAAGLDISTEKACSEKEGNRSSLHTATHSSGHHGTATGGPDATASASQSATSGKGSNAAVDVNVEYHGLSAALLLAALVAL